MKNTKSAVDQQNGLLTWDNSVSTPNVMRTEYQKQQTEEIAETLQESLVKKILTSLEEMSSWERDIDTEDNRGWFKKILIFKKWIKRHKGVGQIDTVIRPDNTISLQINPYDHFDEFYYKAEHVSPEEYLRYSTKFNEILDLKTPEDVLPESKLEKIEYPNMDDINMDDYM